jgi:hypothetical protein
VALELRRAAHLGDKKWVYRLAALGRPPGNRAAEHEHWRVGGDCLRALNGFERAAVAAHANLGGATSG